jgi:hypothetical protein
VQRLQAGSPEVSGPAATPAQKTVRLEMSSSAGAWKTLGRFDAADCEQSSLVLDAAEDLVKTLHNSADPAGCPKLRLTIDDSLRQVLTCWDIESGWRDAVTGEPV